MKGSWIDRRGFARLIERGTIRLLSFVVVCMGLLSLTFILGKAVPVDPTLTLLGDEASESSYGQVRHDWGMDGSVWAQFWRSVLGIATGDWGISTVTGQPVLADIARVLPATVELASVAFLLGSLPGVIAGLLASMRSGGVLDHLVRVIGMAGHSVPIFWLGPLCLSLFYVDLDWVGGPGRWGDEPGEAGDSCTTGFILIETAAAGDWKAFRDAWSHVLLPAILLAIFNFAYVSRVTRTFMLREMGRTYILAARGLGVSSVRLAFRHAWPNAHRHAIMVMIWSYAHLLEGSVLTETVFAWPGIGRYASSALQAADMHALLGTLLVTGGIFIFLNMLADMIDRALAPPVLQDGG